MRILRSHLIVAFGLIQPERFIEYIRTVEDKRNNKSSKKAHFENCIPDDYIYTHYAFEYFRTRTYEEVQNIHADMCSVIKSRGKLYGGEDIFALLPEYTLHVLSMDIDDPLCRQDQKLNWRSCYLQLGQDLLTTAHAAYINVTENRILSHFCWPAVIGTDDRRLSELLERGLAENHFHLNGSTRGFDLSWLCLMNHPSQIMRFFKADKKDYNKDFAEGLNSGVSLGTSDNRLEWKKKALIACWLRVRLFLWLQTGRFEYFSDGEKPYKSLLNMVESMSSREVANIVSEVKYYYGQYGRVKQPNGRLKYLDYAITYDVACADSCCRSLAGERAFLYKSFQKIYSGDCEKDEMEGFKELFYLYILIKSRFRQEIVQVNGKYGFKNFANYQDRKDIIFENYPMYALEAYNLSVRDGIENGNVKSLEMRIGPKNNPREMRNTISSIDEKIPFLKTGVRFGDKYEKAKKEYCEKCFYVLHFPKLPEKNPLPRHKEEMQSYLNSPRNNTLRSRSRKQSKSLAKFFKRYNLLCSRIRGIDACTFEIPCRPEVFATEFRFLRDYFCIGVNNRIKEFVQPKISATYHVGEDFMDIIDGLRAIDEAVLFLEMKSGERLGHAIALGTNVRKYYELKNNWLVLKKQDLLDNIVWAVSKAKTLNIDLNSAFKQKMYDKAAELIYEIYGRDYNICDYFGAWRLRGDHPMLYRFGFFDEGSYSNLSFMGANNITVQYEKRMIEDHYHFEKLKRLRSNAKTSELYSMYHFNYSVREKGDECEQVHITEDYIKLAEALQAQMRTEIAEKRISIECNPSSNVLIGPFDLYEQHPVFTFQPVVPKCGEICQFVSINTDDQGVFDTSLEEEYSLLECALKKQRNPDQLPVYSNMEIYDYLERLRRNGFSQIFPMARHYENR